MNRQNKKQGKKRNNIAFVLALPVLLGMGLAGCSDSGQAPAPSTPIAAKSAQKPISQATTTQVAAPPEAEYVYNAAGRRDPFGPIVEQGEKTIKAADRPPLERYNLYDFKMTGVVWGGFGYNAMVEGPDGKGYFVRVGTVIGMNRGVVKKIMQDKMIVEEKFKNFSGETERKEIVVELRKKQEGMQ